MTVPVALTIAGSDSGGGAGIQADLKTFSALGVYGASVITAVTAQNTRAVTAVHPVPIAVVTAQIDAVFEDLPPRATKTGMLGSTELIEAVARALATRPMPLVVDPVMVAKSGDRLLHPDAVSALAGRLIPLARLITPNLPEAAVLLGVDEAEVAANPLESARELRTLGCEAVLLKGGHGAGAELTDLLVGEDVELNFSAPRIDTRNTHGTGCTYSAAITAGLARGLELGEAVRRAHRWLHEAIRAADALEVGAGHGPVHHFHETWTDL